MVFGVDTRANRNRTHKWIQPYTIIPPFLNVQSENVKAPKHFNQLMWHKEEEEREVSHRAMRGSEYMCLREENV